MTGATETAQVIAKLVPSLPDETARDLHKLLGHEIAAPPPAGSREARLGLLLQLVQHGEVPAVATYEAARGSQSEWPAASTLIRAYGHWLAAVKAAMRLRFESSARSPEQHQHPYRHRAYTRDEVLHAIGRCKQAVGDWPTQWEYEEWAAITREAARRSGTTDPRLPALKPIRRLFGSFHRALAVARSGLD